MRLLADKADDLLFRFGADPKIKRKTQVFSLDITAICAQAITHAFRLKKHSDFQIPYLLLLKFFLQIQKDVLGTYLLPPCFIDRTNAVERKIMSDGKASS